MQIDRHLNSWKNKIPVLIGITAFLSAFYLLFRAFWFDEVLTLQLLIALPLKQIYFAYDIPNNHIVFTLLEKLAYDLLCMPWNLPYYTLRLIPVICGVAGSVLLAKRLIRSCGILCGGLLTLAFVFSMTFALFASAVRGYILGFLLVILFFNAAEKWMKHPSFLHGVLLFAWSLLCIGTAPTNLAGMTGAGLFFLPALIRRKAWKRICYLMLIPFLALGIFYLPILGKFLGCIQLHEGWHSAGHAAGQLYGIFFLIFAGSVPFALFGVCRIWKHLPRLRWNILAGLLIFLLPAGAWILFSTPPFPRVFFPLFAVWIPLLAYGLNGYLRFQKKRPFLFYLPLFLQIVISLLLPRFGAVFVSDHLFPNLRTDDLLAPYYVRNDFQPGLLLGEIQKRCSAGEELHVFVTFDADAPALLFEAGFMNFPEGTLLMDHLNNGAKMDHFPQLSGKKYLISSNESDLARTMKRFGFTRYQNILVSGIQHLDLVE